MSIKKTCLYLLAIFLLPALSLIFCGCSTEDDDGFMGWDDEGSDFGGVFETGKSRTSVKHDIYVAPNTTFEMSRKRSIPADHIDTIYFDKRLNRYVGITRSGHRYPLTRRNGKFVVTEKDTITIKGGPDTPGRVREEYSSETKTNRQGLIIK